ncbi:hypothetical protein [uncultured Tateyamaria sp.]|uniref:hypothetical protein n=1 Tax=uncultured Tateyamaria sp. TaxID=455651 RepID=UPI00261DC68A|nr:hypothetical protein [uncultured Tateyamaria sp.]
MLKLIARSFSLTILLSAIVLTFFIIVLMMAVVLAGEGPVMRGITCQLVISEDCVRKELQQERKRLHDLQRQNREMLAQNKKAEALIKRLSDLDHASSSYVVFYNASWKRHTVTTGHTYASLLDPDTLIAAHCYVFSRVQGAGDRQINLGNMSKSRRLSLPSYGALALRGTGLSSRDIGTMQEQCQWPDGAA